MTKEILEKQLEEYRKQFNIKWRKPYPQKGTKEYLHFYPDVLKGKGMVLELEKIDAGILTPEEMEKILSP